MIQPGRKYEAESGYRYGFNGKENDNEVKGEGNQQDYGMRIYDPRLGKFLSVDPIGKNYPELTPYQFASNNPIWLIDIDGLEGTTSTHTTAPFRLGPPIRPSIIRDNGFLQAYPDIGYVPHPHKPTLANRLAYTKWFAMNEAAKTFRPDLADATAAYSHFLSASGTSFTFFPAQSPRQSSLHTKLKQGDSGQEKKRMDDKNLQRRRYEEQ